MIKAIAIGILIITIVSSHAFPQTQTLEFFLNQGLSGSPVLKDLNNQVQSNSVDSLLVKAGRKPQVDFNTYLMYAPVINGYGYSDVITNGQNLTSTINVSQNIFNKKTIEANYSRFGIKNKSLANSVKLTVNDLKRAITAQYLSAYTAYNEMAINKDLLKEGKEEDGILKKLVEQGLFKQTDYLSFLIAFQSLSLQIANSEIQYTRELSALKVLCGVRDTTTYTLVLPDLSGHPLTTPLNSPLFQRFKIDSLSIQNEMLLMDRHYKPDIKWFSDAGIINNEPKVIYQNFGVSLGLSLALPLYDGNQRKLNIRKLRTSEETRRSYEDFFKLQFDQQLQQLTAELEKTQKLIPQLKKQLEMSGELIKQDKILLNHGSISITDYLIAVKNYISVKKDLNQCEVRSLEILNEINYLNQN
jgi:outer membrane protein TolC